MPGDPAQCRLYAERYWELSKRAKNSARRQNLAALAKLWTKLAAEYEADQPRDVLGRFALEHQLSACFSSRRTLQVVSQLATVMRQASTSVSSER